MQVQTKWPDATGNGLSCMSLSHPLFYYNQVVAYSWNIDMQHVVCAWDVDWESSVSKGS